MTFLPAEIIRTKRDGGALTEAEISAFVAGIADGSVTEGQIAAFAMAVIFRDLDVSERVALTLAMRDSGDVLGWPEGDPVLDKHSTGGVGDNVSLMLAPIVAACGARVPMISGRGLGHTGGTLDKMDSIPGYRSQPSNDLFRRAVDEAGCAIIGQTGDLAPADKRFYAIRDTTATVESVALITASILSKKLAAGLAGLVLDVKTGSGAFMPTLEKSRDLARSLVNVANGAGLDTVALITDMNEPLASTAGNATEVANAVRFLTGHHQDARLRDVVLSLAAEMLVIGGLAAEERDGRAKAQTALASGRAAERFAIMVRVLGGPADFVEKFEDYLPTAPVRRSVTATRTGFVEAVDTRAVGLAVVALGGGRARASDAIDHRVGYTELAGLGDEIQPGQPIGTVWARTEDEAEHAARALDAAYSIGDRPRTRATVVERIAAET